VGNATQQLSDYRTGPAFHVLLRVYGNFPKETSPDLADERDWQRYLLKSTFTNPFPKFHLSHLGYFVRVQPTAGDPIRFHDRPDLILTAGTCLYNVVIYLKRQEPHRSSIFAISIYIKAKRYICQLGRDNRLH
jgi:hypothetical protein